MSNILFFSSRKTQKLDLNWRAGGSWCVERGTLSDFSLSNLLRNIKKIEVGPFGEIRFQRSLTMPKKMKGPLWWKKIWKVPQCRKKLERALQSRPVLYVTRKKGNAYSVQFARPNGSIWHHKILFCKTWNAVCKSWKFQQQFNNISNFIF